MVGEICNRVGNSADFNCDPIPNPCDINPCSSGINTMYNYLH